MCKNDVFSQSPEDKAKYDSVQLDKALKKRYLKRVLLC